MDMPSEEKRSVSTEGDCSDEIVPSGSVEELHQAELRTLSIRCQDSVVIVCTNALKHECQQKRGLRRDFREHRERRITNQASRRTRFCSLINIQAKPRGYYSGIRNCMYKLCRVEFT